MTTKQDVKQAFKTGKGEAIAKALREYFAQGIADGTVKPLQFYEPNQENISGETDIIKVAQQIFSV